MDNKEAKTDETASLNDQQPDEQDETDIKRPPNAYMLFCMDNREKLLQREPDLTYKSVMNRLGELWKNTPPEEQLPYKEKAQQLQTEFKLKYPDYKYKPRKEKPNRQPTNHLVLPSGITSNEASYLMYLGAQALLLNQKGGPQPGQIPATAAAAAAVNADINDKIKNEPSAIPYPTGEISPSITSLAQSNFSQLQQLQNANMASLQQPPYWNQQPKQ